MNIKSAPQIPSLFLRNAFFVEKSVFNIPFRYMIQIGRNKKLDFQFIIQIRQRTKENKTNQTEKTLKDPSRSS